jgi:hypothetical protein
VTSVVLPSAMVAVTAFQLKKNNAYTVALFLYAFLRHDICFIIFPC